MRRVRLLAVARYRFLTILRSANASYVILMVAIAVPLLGMFTTLRVADSDYPAQAPRVLSDAAFGTFMIYGLHLLALVVICGAYGVVPRRPPGVMPIDPMHLAPISGSEQFWGDAAGLFSAVASIHLCLVPLLAAAIALSPFPSSLFWYGEVLTAIALLFASACGSWALRAETTRLSQTRAARSIVVFLILMTVAVLFTTRGQEFRDALAFLWFRPTLRQLELAAAAVSQPILLVVSLVSIYVAFIAYYCFSSVRAIERS
jgi:hypothetical protein